jgi:uncharacterized protein (TIGR02996 family)
MARSRSTWFEKDVTPKQTRPTLDAEQARLIAAVLAAPDEDAPRLVYADWLLERSDPRGELITVQCEIHQLDSKNSDDARIDELRAREMALLTKHKKTWVGAFAGTRTEHGTKERSWVKGSPTKWTFERGFVRDVTMSTRDLARNAKELFAAEPVARVHVTDADIDAVLQCDGIENLRELDVSRNRLKDTGVRALFSAKNLRSLETLDLTKCGIGPSAVRTMIDASGSAPRKRFPKLRQLVLCDNALVDKGAKELAEFSLLAIEGLGLDLARNKIGPAGAMALAKSPHLASVGRLDLFGNFAILEDEETTGALRRRFGKRVVLSDDDLDPQ